MIPSQHLALVNSYEYDLALLWNTVSGLAPHCEGYRGPLVDGSLP